MVLSSYLPLEWKINDFTSLWFGRYYYYYYCCAMARYINSCYNLSTTLVTARNDRTCSLCIKLDFPCLLARSPDLLPKIVINWLKIMANQLYHIILTKKYR